jgi:GntR family transcriptional repressor for pyruvate dehydrogenase complex
MTTRNLRTGLSVPELNNGRRRKLKIVDEIIESLRQDIVTRRLADGQRLPREKILSERFGVSQPTIREAIRALETLGLVDVFHGNGTFVRSQGDYALASALQTLLQLESVGIIEVLELRQVLGGYSIEAAAANATKEDIEAIALACERFDQLDKVKDVDGVLAQVIDFQLAVSAASHRPLLQSLEAVLLALLNEVQVKSLTGRSVRFWRGRALQFQDHRIAIVEAIRSRDPARARLAMDDYTKAQRALLEQEQDLQALNLSNPNLIPVVARMVQQFKD